MTKLLITVFLACCSFAAQAAVEITDAWARATPPGQEVGAAYMNLKSDHDANLVGATSSVADSVETHEMSMKNGVMKMRMLDVMSLPAGKTVKLEPSGFHLMLIGLKKSLAAGDTIEIELSVKDAKGKVSKQKVSVPVKSN